MRHIIDIKGAYGDRKALYSLEPAVFLLMDDRAGRYIPPLSFLLICYHVIKYINHDRDTELSSILKGKLFLSVTANLSRNLVLKKIKCAQNILYKDSVLNSTNCKWRDRSL